MNTDILRRIGQSRAIMIAGRILLLAALYYGAGKLALLLATPPGAATVVWPPSGIALAALLLYGNRVWPGVFLGSFALYLAIFFDPSGAWAETRSVLLALTMSLGASLQAAVGAALVRRVVALPLDLVREQDVAKFFLLGPMSCLISASLGVGALTLVGSLPLNQAAHSWLTWWLGDSIGATVVPPLLFVWLAEPRPVWRRRALSVAVPLTCVLALTVVVFVWITHIEAQRIRAEFQKRSANVTEAVDANFDRTIRLVRSFGDLYGAIPAADQSATFSMLARRMLETNPEILTLSWNPRVTAGERASFERRAQLAGYQGFGVLDRMPEGTLVPASVRDEHVVVLHMEPSESTSVIRGVDVASDPLRRAALQRACSTGRAGATTALWLVRERQYGVLVFVPVYQGGLMPRVVEQRCAAIRGFITGVFRVSQVMRTAMKAQDNDHHVHVALQGDTSRGRQTVWTDSDEGSAPSSSVLTETGLVKAGGRTWSVISAATSSYQASAGMWRPGLALAAGMLFSGLVAAFLLIVTGKAVIIERLGTERARELSSANESLHREIAERKQAQEALFANEAKLRQAQKMEAIGRLAGGVAHDFNNLLTTILGYADLILRDVGTTSSAAADVGEIQQAGESAARLTRQLLAFSRQQVLQPIVLNLNDEIARVRGLLRRLIGEDIRLTVEMAPDLCCVKADRGFVEQVLFNLAANARDAMPNGGRLDVTTTMVDLPEPRQEQGFVLPAGQYAVLSVADTGIGMDPETQAHIFEPFFSTKGNGGTGLGLATVYSIVKQSHGFVSLVSAPNRGTVFHIYLPYTPDAVCEPTLPTPTLTPETKVKVLLVEDENTVRHLVSTLLRNRGYSVVEAGDPLAALDIVRSSTEPLELLLTDMVMPGMHGRALAQEVALLRPGIRTLFISGYTNQHVEADQAYLQKPFTPDALLHKVRDVLEAVPESADMTGRGSPS